jgi:hypothetical protein
LQILEAENYVVRGFEELGVTIKAAERKNPSNIGRNQKTTGTGLVISQDGQFDLRIDKEAKNDLLLQAKKTREQLRDQFNLISNELVQLKFSNDSSEQKLESLKHTKKSLGMDIQKVDSDIKNQKELSVQV